MKFPYITQLKYCRKLGFEADPVNKLKLLIKKLKFSFSKSSKFPYIMQLKYCQKLDIEADPIHKLKPLIKKLLFDFKINEISLYNAIKILPKMGFRSGIRNYVYVSYGITC